MTDTFDLAAIKARRRMVDLYARHGRRAFYVVRSVEQVPAGRLVKRPSRFKPATRDDTGAES